MIEPVSRITNNIKTPFTLFRPQEIESNLMQTNNLQPQESIWDPAGEGPNEQYLESRNKKNTELYEYYKAHPKKIRRNIFILVGLAVFGYVLMLISPFSTFFLAMFDSLDEAGGILALPIAPLLIYWIRIRNLQKDLIKKLVADRNNWFYSPSEDILHLQKIKSKFPYLLPFGIKENVQDEFWGNLEDSKGKKIPFYSCIFEYQKGNEKKKKSKKYKTIFAIKLNKTLINSLKIQPKGMFSKLFSFFSSSNHIEMEYQEFNNKFSVRWNNKNNDRKKIEIFRKLSPSVQIILVDLAEKFPSLEIIFKKDTFFFIRDGFLFDERGSFGQTKNMMKTNFFKEVKLDPHDEEYLHEKINTLLEIAKEIPQYLD